MYTPLWETDVVYKQKYITMAQLGEGGRIFHTVTLPDVDHLPHFQTSLVRFCLQLSALHSK